MFSLCMVESGADEVNLHGVTSLGLKQALEFAYTGQVWYKMTSERLNIFNCPSPEEILLKHEIYLFFLFFILTLKKKKVSQLLNFVTKMMER